MLDFQTKILRKFISVLIFGLVFFVTGCPTPLDTVLDEPNMGLDNERPKSYLPANLVATHGKYREIELSWEPCDNATRYYIYQSTTPFSDFKQIGETGVSENSYTVSAKSSALFYYKVTAVTSRGEETIPSNTAMGTTLSTPVISDIASETESGHIIVKWYMENSQYYESGSIAYSIVCYDKGGTEIARSPLITDATADKTTFTGLEPKTTYWFEVEVYNLSDQSKTEKSGKLDAETARRMRPPAPENLSVTQGAWSDKTVISFTKPAMVDVKVGGDFKETPLDFRVERREVYPYETNFENITDSLTDKASLTHTGDYENYVVGDTITVADTNAHRGRRYEYIVRSYTHNTSNTTEYSMAVAEGWAVPNIVYRMSRSDYEKDANGRHIAVTLSGKLEFDAFGKDDDYQYDLSYDFYEKQATGYFAETPTRTDERLLSGVSRADLENYNMPLQLPQANGKYHFKVSVTNKISGWKEDVKATRSEIVSDEVIKTIENLEVEDGYPDQFIVSWTAEENVEYMFSYKKEGDASFTQQTTPITGNGTYKHTFNTNVESGKKYQFKIMATGGDEKETELYSTLGTPVVQFDENSAQLDKITVKWKPVEKATDYRIKYSYGIDNRGSEYNSATTIRDGKAMSFNELSEKDEFLYEADGRAEYSHTFEKPAGYDNMLFAGRPMIVTVEAINEERNNVSTTGQNTNTRVLGPYLATKDATASVAEAPDQIQFSWKKVPGAKGYYISRIRYNVSNKPAEENTRRDSDIEVVYYYAGNENGKTLSVPSHELQNISADIAQVQLSGETFTLTDNYKPQSTDDTSGFYKEQDRLAWGYPFRYQVFPVTEETGFDRNNEEQCILGEKVTYIDTKNEANYKTGSALGWGIDVTASKATSEKHIALNWTKPYTKGATNVTPTIWRRRYNSSSDSDWRQMQISNLSNDTKNYRLERLSTETKVDETDFQAFDYVVKYINGSSYASIAPKPAYIEDRKDTSGGEAKNKGYFFSININTNRITGQSPYAEALHIAPWNYTERKNGPDKYVVRLKNKNISANWYDIATIPDPKNFSTIKWNNIKHSNRDENIWIDTEGIVKKVEPGNVLLFEPKFDPTNKTHDGFLKVLRDYKHYYQVFATRTDNSDTVEAAPEAFASRQITLEEFTKVTIIGLSTGIDETRTNEKGEVIGVQTNGRTIWQNGAETLRSVTSYQAATDYKVVHNFQGYDALHTPQSGEGKVSAVKIQGQLKARGGTSGGWSWHYYNENGQNGNEWMNIEYYGYKDSSGNNMKGQILFVGRDSKTDNKVTRLVNGKGGGTIKVKYNGSAESITLTNDTKATYNGSAEKEFNAGENTLFTLPFMSGIDGKRTKDFPNWK